MDEELTNLEETAASETLKPDSMPSDKMTKSDMLAKMMGHMNGMKKSSLIDFFNKSMAQFGPNVDLGVPAGAAAHNKGTIVPKGNPVKEDIDEMFSGSDLSEEFKEKISTLVESAVNAKLNISIAQLQEEQETAFNALVEEYKEELTESMDEYLSYSVAEWVKENQVGIEESIKRDLQASFMSGLHKLFAEHYVEVPEEKYDLIGTLEKEIEELKTALNDIQNSNISLSTANEELECKLVFADLTRDLTESDALKFESLIEDISFDGVGQFRTKLETIKEAHFGNTENVVKEQEEVIGIQSLSEEEEAENEEINDPVMRSYVEHFLKISKNQ